MKPTTLDPLHASPAAQQRAAMNSARAQRPLFPNCTLIADVRQFQKHGRGQSNERN